MCRFSRVLRYNGASTIHKTLHRRLPPLTARLALLRCLLLVALVFGAWLPPNVRAATAHYTIGVLAYRDAAQTAQRWQPLADYLSAQVADARFTLETYNNAQLDTAISRGEVDFVFAQPAHYIRLSIAHSLSAPLATLVNQSAGQALAQFGGVIFTRATNDSLQSLTDIAGKTVASVDRAGLGGHLMQQYTLQQAGLEMDRHYAVIEVGQPQDRVVSAVLDGRADVGFVRTGLIESLVAEHRLDGSRLRIINARTSPNFPLALSTDLYSEWPFAALQHISPTVVREVASALLNVANQTDLKRSLRIGGFTVAGDYRRVDHLLRELGAPPYEPVHPRHPLLAALWSQWPYVLGATLVVLLGALTLSVLQNFRLRQTRNHLEFAARHNHLLMSALKASRSGVLLIEPDGTVSFINDAFHREGSNVETTSIGGRPIASSNDRDAIRLLTHSLSTARNQTVEINGIDNEGRRYTDSIVIEPIIAPNGLLLGHLVTRDDITAIKRDAEHLRTLAYGDQLTGLGNRARLLDVLCDAIGAGKASANNHLIVILVNLDRFTMINDALGHAAGDHLLLSFARRLNDAFESRARLIARTSGDEFALVLSQAPDRNGTAARIAQLLSTQVLGICREPFVVGRETVNVTASIGVCVAEAEPALTPSDLLSRADVALQQARRGGGNRAEVFEPAMQAKLNERFQIEGELRIALRCNELELHAQPQYRTDGAVHGAEVLVRWPHAERGFISPAMFIPVAEQSDLIISLSQFIFAGSLDLLNRLSTLKEDIQLSINLSPRFFRQPDFVNWFKGLLAMKAVDPKRVMLEITESLFVGNVDETAQRMRQLTALGVRFSIDDFGTGYSSLSYLKQLPIHEIKIDRSFIDGICNDARDRALVRAFFAIAEQLGYDVVAEGVENREQAELLADMSSRVLYQGFHFDRPQPLEHWVERWSPRALEHA